MPLDTSLLYGEMAGSWLCHLAVPLVVATGVSVIGGLTQTQKALTLLGVTVFISFFIQFGFLVFLQQSACNGVKDYLRVLKGAGVGMLITAIMVAIPLFWEAGRLMVSQLFVDHKTLLTPAEAAVNDALVETSKKVVAQVGGALSAPEYDAQTFTEMAYGAAYWSAFAGAYGIGAGSLIASRCSATS